MYMCVCVCVYICVYTHIYVYIYMVMEKEKLERKQIFVYGICLHMTDLKGEASAVYMHDVCNLFRKYAVNMYNICMHITDFKGVLSICVKMYEMYISEVSWEKS